MNRIHERRREISGFLEVAEGIVKVAVPARVKEKRVGNGSSGRHFVG